MSQFVKARWTIVIDEEEKALSGFHIAHALNHLKAVLDVHLERAERILSRLVNEHGTRGALQQGEVFCISTRGEQRPNSQKARKKEGGDFCHSEVSVCPKKDF